MSFRVFKFLIILGTIIAWSGFGLVVSNLDPNQTNFLGFSILYFSLFLALSGSLFLVNDWLKSKVFRRQLLLQRVRISVRHAIFFTIFILGWIFLKSHSLLHWWNLILLVLILATLEFFFISSQKSHHYEREDFTTPETI